MKMRTNMKITCAVRNSRLMPGFTALRLLAHEPCPTLPIRRTPTCEGLPLRESKFLSVEIHRVGADGMKRLSLLAVLSLLLAGCQGMPRSDRATAWRVGDPIVTYYCGPAMSDGAAQQMKEGGWNVVWCDEKDLDVAHRHGLRAQLKDPLLSPASLEQPDLLAKLDALIARVRSHPALYSYYIIDEPSAAQFPALGKLVAHLRTHDPAHLAYINLFPNYASNDQLGNRGDIVKAYTEHLIQFVANVKPSLLSYDHYHFGTNGDSGLYFLNLAQIRSTALDAGVPFLNIVQACSWAPVMRVPTPEEMRFLLYTTLAYGAQGISYYVYTCGGHTGAIANADGTPTPLYHALKPLNHEFVAIALQLQPLRSLGIYHAGMQPQGAESLPANAAFTLDPPVLPQTYTPPDRVSGTLLGFFGPPGKTSTSATATHAVIVNLDYKTEAVVNIKAARKLERFDAASGKWIALGDRVVHLRLPGGGGALIRISKHR